MDFIDIFLREAFKPEINELKGKIGEYEISYILQHLNGYGKYINNIYVPYRNYTAEIDIVLVHEKGIFVIESKNYAGWIFGSKEKQCWTQSLYNGQKNKLYNPIKQNQTHINALSTFLKIPRENIISVVAFSERCELKKVPEDTRDCIISKIENLLYKLRLSLNERKAVFKKEEIDEIVKKLIPLARISNEEKIKRIEEIKKK